MGVIENLVDRYGDPGKMSDDKLRAAIEHERQLASSAKAIWTMSSRRFEELTKVLQSRLTTESD